jgi:UDP-N-acetylglucosamine 2-epimerase
MSHELKIVSVVGARPQFVKLAPVSRAIRGRHQEFVVHTGQHYDDNLSASFFKDLEIDEPDLNLGIGSGSHAEQTAAAMTGIEKVLADRIPDLVLVYGDTNSTLAGAIAAAKLDLPLAHVEAGLRSFNRAMPEEVNRVLTDHCSELLFAPTPRAVENLGREGIVAGVHWTGDVMYDSAIRARPLAEGRFDELAATLGVEPRGYLLATVHRAENTDDRGRLKSILTALMGTGEKVVLPLHPRTRKMLEGFGLWPAVEAATGLLVVEPLGYFEMLALEMNARVIVTDSGGVQKESYFAGTPVVTLREETEWTETVEAGWNQLAGTDPGRILAALAGATPGGAIDAYGEGRAAEQIAALIDVRIGR